MNLNLPFLSPIASAVETTLTETDLNRALPVAGDSVRLEVPPYGVKTIRVRSAAEPCGEVKNVTAKAVSDMEVAVEWEPVPGAAFYRVYRGISPDFNPSLLTLVAMPAVAHFVDKAQDHFTGWIANRLQPETAYYYRVEVVSRHNERGPASVPVVATTLATATNACTPGPVLDLHAILVSPLAPVNQINLLWRSNVEPNIAGYEIHRSTAAGFTPSAATLLAKVDIQRSTKATGVNTFSHQMFLDEKPAFATTYYYRVRTITRTGLPGGFSSEAFVATKSQDPPIAKGTP